MSNSRRSHIATTLAALAVLGSPAAAMAAPGHVSRAAEDDPLGAAGILRDINLLPGNDAPAPGGPERNGRFGAPFTEPTIDGVPTSEKCIADEQGIKNCKPAAGSTNVLPDGRILYWNALEGTENNRFSIVAEGGQTFTNDQSRVLTIGDSPSWLRPDPVRGGANPDGGPGDPLIPGAQSDEAYNDGALFGSHNTFLADGRVLVQGGTEYSADPNVPGTSLGVVELGGLKSTRIYNPADDRFEQVGDAIRGRWYPTMVPLANGEVANFSGVRKLIKPVYRDDPMYSGTNVRQTERFDPATNRWTDEGRAAERSLPLYPRMHLLPNGNVFYNTAGQSYNPQGQSYDQATWNIPAVYDTGERRWRDLTPPRAGDLLSGFRGSTFSTELALRPDEDGDYTQSRFLTGGGVLGLVAAGSPGSYFPTRSSKVTTVDTSRERERIAIERTGDMNQPRWFSSGTLLPTGEVLATSGGDKDEVVGPGTEVARQQAELYDPETETWSRVATARQPRTYHNTAALLPSGEVLVGGHAPISTLYTNNTTLPGGFAPHDGRDPSFEVYKPPYLFRGDRPTIRRVRGTFTAGRTYGIRTDVPASEIESVMLIRNTATTHLVDGGQRGVELRIRRRNGRLMLVDAPPSAVAAPGPYMLFVNRRTDDGPVPSQARMISVRGR